MSSIDDLAWPSTAEVYPPGPTGVYAGETPHFAVPSRSAILAHLPPPTPSEDLGFFIVDVDVLPFTPQRFNGHSLDAAMHSADDVLFDPSIDPEDRDPEADDTYALKQAMWRRRENGVVVIKAVLPDGRTAAIMVSDYKDRFVVRVRKRDVLMPSAFDSMLRACEKGIRAKVGALSRKHIRRSLCYHFHPNASDPTKHAVFDFFEIHCASSNIRRNAAQWMAKHSLTNKKTDFPWTPEEWTLSSEVTFMQALQLKQRSWAYMKGGAFTIVPNTEKFSLRDVNITTTCEALGSVDALSPEEIERRGLPPPITAPSLLMASVDIETKADKDGQNPNPDIPSNVVTVIGISFYYTGSVPFAFRRPTTEEGRARAMDVRARQEDMCRRNAEEMRALMVAEAKRGVEEQSEAFSRWNARVDGCDPHLPKALTRSLDLRADFSVDDEVSKAEKKARKSMEGEIARLDERCKTYAWPTCVGDMTERARVSDTAPIDMAACDLNTDACRVSASASERMCASNIPSYGVVPGEAFLHVVLVNAEGDVDATGSGAIDGAIVENHRNETSMLRSFRSWLMGIMDVDGVRGYNILGYDWPYIVTRAKMLGIEDEVFRMSHVLDSVTRPYQKNMKRGNVITTWSGVDVVDLLEYMRTMKPGLNKYSLQNVSEVHGLAGKHDVSYTHVNRAFRIGGRLHRAIVGAYCAQDANLCVQLADRSKSEDVINSFAKIMETPPSKMWTSGEQERVVNMIFARAHKGIEGTKFVINHLRYNPDQLFNNEGGPRIKFPSVPIPEELREDVATAMREEGCDEAAVEVFRQGKEMVKENTRADRMLGGTSTDSAWMRDLMFSNISFQREVAKLVAEQRVREEGGHASTFAGESPLEGGNNMLSNEISSTDDIGVDEITEEDVLRVMQTDNLSRAKAKERLEKKQKKFVGGHVFPPLKFFFCDRNRYKTLEVPGARLDVREVVQLLSDEKSTHVVKMQHVLMPDGTDVNATGYGFIFTLDFKSLYPSMQISHNLCYSTYIPPNLAKMPGYLDMLEKRGLRVLRVPVPIKQDGKIIGTVVNHFAQNVVSVVPTMLEELWAERQRVKKLMNAAKDAGDYGLYARLDAIQKAVKVSMNSFFGTSGVSPEKGKYPLGAIAGTITFLGAKHTKEAHLIAESYKEKGMIELVPVQLVYGDTDSIMVRVPPPNMRWLRRFRIAELLPPVEYPKQEEGESWKSYAKRKAVVDAERKAYVEAIEAAIMGEPEGEGVDIPECVGRGMDKVMATETYTYEERVLHSQDVANAITARCNALYEERDEKSVELENEECSVAMLLQAKKQYAKALSEKVKDLLKQNLELKISGIAAKKRDRSKMESRTQALAIRELVLGNNLDGAWKIIVREMLRMAFGDVQKGEIYFAKRINDYAPTINRVAPAHVVAAWAMERERAGSEPGKGDFIHYWFSNDADMDSIVPSSKALKKITEDVKESLGMAKTKTSDWKGAKEVRDENQEMRLPTSNVEARRALREMVAALSGRSARAVGGAKVLIENMFGLDTSSMSQDDIKALSLIREKISEHQRAAKSKTDGASAMHARPMSKDGKPFASMYIKRMYKVCKVVLGPTEKAGDLDILYEICKQIAKDHDERTLSKKTLADGHRYSWSTFKNQNTINQTVKKRRQRKAVVQKQYMASTMSLASLMKAQRKRKAEEEHPPPTKEPRMN